MPPILRAFAILLYTVATMALGLTQRQHYGHLTPTLVALPLLKNYLNGTSNNTISLLSFYVNHRTVPPHQWEMISSPVEQHKYSEICDCSLTKTGNVLLAGLSGEKCTQTYIFKSCNITFSLLLVDMALAGPPPAYQHTDRIVL